MIEAMIYGGDLYFWWMRSSRSGADLKFFFVLSAKSGDDGAGRGNSLFSGSDPVLLAKISVTEEVYLQMSESSIFVKTAKSFVWLSDSKAGNWSV